MASCATDGCDNPDCGPCTIYSRFPDLRAYDEAQATLRAVRNATRGGKRDLIAQGALAARRRKRRGPKDM